MEITSIHSEPLLSASSTSTVFPLPPPAELDVKLPKVCEALVLITQCIVTISLEAEEQRMLFKEGRSSLTNFKNMKEYFNEKKSSDQGIVENLIDLLRQFDLFLPRINFGKPVNLDGSPSRSQNTDGFFYLKRDLVRLLGVLCHGVRAVQDRTRVAGGLPVVMNLCVIDERNPYLREHAIFTLRNLLENNRENQQFVHSLKPSQEWDDNGTLNTIAGAVLK
jgi:ataxin-10